jgi:hypothetical protein
MNSTQTRETVTEPPAAESAAIGHTVVMAESNGHSKSRTKIGITTGVVLVALLVASVTGYHLTHPAPACSDAFLKNAGMHFDGPHRSQLIKDVAEIQSKKDYAKDPNCLYVVMEYNIHSSDSAKATKTYAQLEKAYNPAKGFSHSLGPNLKTMADFKASTSFLKREDIELLRNTFGVPQP